MKRLVIAIAVVAFVFSVFSIKAYAEELDGQEEYAITLTALNFRDENGNLLDVVPEDEVVTVLRVDSYDPKRDWVFWAGKEGSVIRTGLDYLGVTVEEYAQHAVAKTELNMRIPETYEFMLSVPKGGEVTILGEDEYHSDRWIVDYQGIVGSVVKSGLLPFGTTDIIIVDIDAQIVQMLKGGRVLCYSKIVTGMRDVYDTPRGMYSIQDMERDATLKGPGYEAHVKYWMPFFKGYGLHDASWRSSFGDSVYVFSGSHGCVNLPEHVARTMFENAYKGYLVMVH